jgi:HAD superfamily hydrolase (TIGR01509 family)
VRDFLASRGISLPEGTPDDPPDQPYEQLTVNGVGNRKNVILLRRVHDDGVEPYGGSVVYLEAAKAAGLRRVVVSASANCKDVLHAAGLSHLLEERVDGVTLAEKHLRGKPAPDGFLEGAKTVGVDPAHCAVFEDALSGVAAGKAGNFGFVVGVNRVNQAQALLEHGATVVVDDLADLLTQPPNGDPR